MLVASPWRTRAAHALQQKPLIVVELVLSIIALFTIGTPGLLLIALLSLWLQGNLRSMIGALRWKDWAVGLAAGLGKLILYPLIILVIARSTGLPFDTTKFDGLRGNVLLFVKLIPVLWIASAAVEEIGFRSYLLNRFADLFGGPRQALLVGVLASSVLFGLAHLSDQGWFGVIDTTISAVIYAAIYRRTRRVWASVIAHAVFDTVALGALVFSADIPFRHLAGL